MDPQQQKRRRIPWRRWLIVLVVLILIIAVTVLSIVDSQGTWINILPGVIIAILSVIIGLFQWLFPVSSATEGHSTPHMHVAPASQGGAVNPSSLPPIIVQMPTPTTQHLVEPPPPKTAYRSIVSIPPPTDPRTIQQREKAVKEVYARLTQSDVTAIALTGIGGVGKSTLAALVYRYMEEQRRAGNGPFTAQALWLKIDSSAVTMTDLAGTIFDALGKPLPDLSNKERGLKYYEQALAIFREEKDLAGESTALTNLGWVYYDLGRLQRAQEYYEQALSIRREGKDRLEEAASLNSLGRVYANLGQLEQARAYHEQALDICREIGYRGEEGWALNNLGRVYLALGDQQQALDYLRQALTIRREIGNRGGEASTLNNLGRLYLDLGSIEQARECFEQALPIRREVGDRNGEAKTLINLGYIYAALGKKESVLTYYKQALNICQELGHRNKEVKVLNSIGLFLAEQCRYDLALACFLFSSDIFARSQSLHSEEKPRYDAAQHHIDNLHEKTGDEQFKVLMEQVGPKARQIAEEALEGM